MAARLLAMAHAWSRLDAELKELRGREAEARAQLVAAAFPGGVGLGVNIAELGGGAKVKAFVRPNQKIEPMAFRAALDQLAKIRGVGKLLAERLAKWKPEISLTEWKQLSDEQRALFAGAVRIETSTPSVELVGV